MVINFENGFVKEGPLYVFPNRMNKEEYNKMIQEANKSVAAKRKVETLLREKMQREKEMESRIKSMKKKEEEEEIEKPKETTKEESVEQIDNKKVFARIFF